MSLQFVRESEVLWRVTRVREIWQGAYEYELLGRVVLESGLYWPERARYVSDGCKFDRGPRGYHLPVGAFKWLEQPPVQS